MSVTQLHNNFVYSSTVATGITSLLPEIVLHNSTRLYYPCRLDKSICDPYMLVHTWTFCAIHSTRLNTAFIWQMYTSYLPKIRYKTEAYFC